MVFTQERMRRIRLTKKFIQRDTQQKEGEKITARGLLNTSY